MRLPLSWLVAVVLLSGCATSNVQTRKKERATVYSSLSPEFQALVDQGRIKTGMPMEAVYIAWGKPSQILSGEGPNGVTTTTWLYTGTALEEYRYWGYRPYYSGRRSFSGPSLEHDYYPRGYVSAEVNFEGGVVKAWRTLPQPAS